MSTKTVCDGCGAELDGYTDHIEGSVKALGGIPGVPNAFHLCDDCAQVAFAAVIEARIDRTTRPA